MKQWRIPGCITAALVMSAAWQIGLPSGLVAAADKSTANGLSTSASSNISGTISITGPQSIKAGDSATMTVTGNDTNFEAGQTKVTVENEVNGTIDLTRYATINSPTSLTIAFPGGEDGLGAGTYTLKITTNGVAQSTDFTVQPFTDANTVQWDGIYTSQDKPYLSDPTPNPGSQITIAFQAYSGNLTAAKLQYYDTAQGKGFTVDMKPGRTWGPYQLWYATVPTSAGGTIWYRFDLYDGDSFACLSGDGLHTADTNQNNFPVPVGDFSLSTTRAQVGDTITAYDNLGDFSGGSTTAYFVDSAGKTLASVEGHNAGWSSVQFNIPQGLPDGLYTVQVVTAAKDANGVVNTELKRQTLLAIGTAHYWFDDLKHDSFSSFYRSPFGAVKTGTSITLRLRGPKDLSSATLRVWNLAGKKGETDFQMKPVSFSSTEIRKETGDDANKYSWWEVTVPAADVTKTGALWYQFAAREGNQTVYYDDNGSQLEGIGQPGFNPGGKSYQISVYRKDYHTPDWLKHAVIYEVFPERFFNGDISNDENPKTQKGVGTTADGKEGLVPIQFHENWNDLPYDPAIQPDPSDPNYQRELQLRGDGNWSTDFFGGDLRGIEYKLDYLQSLGVNTLYLTPIFQSESNHKYDTGDFVKIDPGFGTMKTYLDLVKAAKARGMHIILDGVFEDTGSDSKYFNRFGRYDSTGAWQEYEDASKKSPYFSWYEWTNNPTQPYQSWWGYDTLPLTNTNDPGWRNFVYGDKNSVAKFWLRAGASGWRLDSADNGNFNVTWWSAFRKAVKAVDPDAVIIGEVWNNATNDNGTDWLTGSTFDSVMNYQFRNALIDFFRGDYNDGNQIHNQVDAAGLNQELMRLYSEYPKPAFYTMMNLVDSHDTMRILTVLENAPAPDTLSAYQQATYTPPTTEKQTGLERLKLLTDLQFAFPGAPTIYYGDEAGVGGYKDPLDRQTYPWGHVNEDLLNHYRQLGAIRNDTAASQTGDFTPLYTKGNIYAFARTIRNGKDVFGHKAENGTAVVALNNQPMAATVQIPVKDTVPDGMKLLDALNNRWVTVQDGMVRLTLGAYEGAVLITPSTQPIAFMQASKGKTTVSWTPVQDVQGYRLWVENAAGHWHPQGKPLSAKQTSVNISQLVSSKTLHVRVQALFSRSANGTDAMSAVVTVPAAGLKMGLVQAVQTQSGWELSWDRVPNADRYEIYGQTADGQNERIGVIQSTDKRLHFHVGEWSGNYQFRVAAVNEDNISYSSPVPAK
ncbi:MAG: glycoside hydrolase family 13 protein [Alicyclobacillus sp.]|nr:glycoside hydrolase family 13 protein [Alicyclobacillus sp.]